MAQYFDPGRLLPAAHDQGLAALGLQVDQTDEPAGYLLNFDIALALHHDPLVRDTEHADAGEVAAVENRADHQLDHRRIVGMGRHRQAEGGGGVLGV
ncbi:hypothetical protein D3C84_1120290 [compost metagenome]